MKFGERMKKYEAVSDITLVPNCPFIIRIDGRAFHTFTKGLKKPFDDELNQCMEYTMKSLCENISDVVIGYTQSDEITLICRNDITESKNGAWFDGRIQKIASVSASMATVAFNSELLRITEKNPDSPLQSKKFQATFDSRVFSVPRDEAVNNLIWRQRDASKNSVNSLAYAHFPDKRLLGLSNSEKQDLLMLEKGINWNDTPTRYKRGSACIRVIESFLSDDTSTEYFRKIWKIDREMPILTFDCPYILENMNFSS